MGWQFGGLRVSIIKVVRGYRADFLAGNALFSFLYLMTNTGLEMSRTVGIRFRKVDTYDFIKIRSKMLREYDGI